MNNVIQYKTSKEWLELVPEKHNLQIISPDGWDRKNFDYSFNQQKITKQMFLDKLSYSTISCRNAIGLFSINDE